MSDVNTSAVFSAFIEADRALKELPAVREELANVKAEHEATLEAKAKVEAQNSFLDQALSALRAELAQREAELASATFRHGELAKVVDHIRSVLPGLAPVDSPAPLSERSEDTTVLAEPKDPSVTDPTATASSEVQSVPSADTVANTSNGDNDTQVGQRDTDPTAVESQPDQSQNVQTPSVGNWNTAASNPTEVANFAPIPNPSAESHGPTENYPTDPDGSPDGLPSPTASANDLANPYPQPFAGWPDYRKPWGMPWSEYVRGGGIAPDWMADPYNNHAA